MHTTRCWVFFSRYGTIVLTLKNLLLGICLWFFLCVLCFMLSPSSADAVIGGCLAGILLAVSFTDYSTLNIPHGLIGGIAVLACTAYLVGSPADLGFSNRCIGSCIASIPLLVYAIAFNGFGGGDIKLMAVMGFLLGEQRALVALFLALALGCIYAFILVLTRNMTRKDTFPFGPALSAGSFIAFLL